MRKEDPKNFGFTFSLIYSDKYNNTQLIPVASQSDTQVDKCGVKVSKSNFPVLVPVFKYQYRFSSSMMSASRTEN